MPISELRLIKKCAEFLPKDEISHVPRGTRGIYALLCYRPRLGNYDVVYIGMSGAAAGRLRGRLKAHARAKKKKDLWTHFSVFEVWDNIREEEIRELEGILRHIYKKDTKANSLNKQQGFKKLNRVRKNKLTEW